MYKYSDEIRFTHSEAAGIETIIERIRKSARDTIFHDQIDSSEISKQSLAHFNKVMDSTVPDLIRAMAKFVVPSDKLHFHYTEEEFHHKKNMATWTLRIQNHGRDIAVVRLRGTFSKEDAASEGQATSNEKTFRLEVDQSI